MKWTSFINKIWEGRFGATLLLFALVLCGFFYDVFVPGQTKFSNDGPLGELMAQCHQLPERFMGCWSDLNNVGFDAGVATPGISLGLQWLLGPIWFSKTYGILSLLILGLGAWCFFRSLQLKPLACVLGGLVAMLNATFFSVACWGVGAHDITAGMAFFALAALADLSAKRSWLRVMLAGFAVGMGVIEGADVGVLFSLLVALFIVYQPLVAEGSRLKNIARGWGRLILVVACAVFIAAQSVFGLINTSVKGVLDTSQQAQTKTQRWNWATQWSLPKKEVLNLVVPGLFGFRMDTPDGGNYWGMIGRAAEWDQYLADGEQGPPPTGFLRYSGGGNYTGEFVLLVALWAVAQSLRRKDVAFDPHQRRWLWFWLVVAVVSLLLALGRYAPFYQFIYELPYFSSIRNPIKFLYLFSFAITILFAFGLDGLARKYMSPTDAQAGATWGGLQSWWSRATRFEKYWMYGCGIILAAALVAWLDYANQRQALEEYLQSVRVGAPAGSVADFSIHQAGWFPLAFSLAAGFLALLFSGAFRGRRAKTGGILLGVLLLTEFGLANAPWIVFWNYQEKYASNPIVDLLREEPYEHRVVMPPLRVPPRLMALQQVYRKEWMQHLFPYYNIQSFDLVEMSRMPEDFAAFKRRLDPLVVGETNALRNMVRAWQLTNTRYILAPADYASGDNEQFFPPHSGLQIISRFEFLPKPGVIQATMAEQLTAMPDAFGRFAIFEFDAALPRAKLYADWQVCTNDAVALDRIFDPAFDPRSSLVLDGALPPGAVAPAGDGVVGAVNFVSYSPKDIVLKASAPSPSIMLLNDHYDPNWKVSVDGKPAGLLRCNFFMRGVYLEPGDHVVEFKFRPPVGLLYVTAAAFAVASSGLCILLVSNRRKTVPVSAAASVAVPVPPLAQKPRNEKPRAKKGVSSRP